MGSCGTGPSHWGLDPGLLATKDRCRPGQVGHVPWGVCFWRSTPSTAPAVPAGCPVPRWSDRVHLPPCLAHCIGVGHMRAPPPPATTTRPPAKPPPAPLLPRSRQAHGVRSDGRARPRGRRGAVGAGVRGWGGGGKGVGGAAQQRSNTGGRAVLDGTAQCASTDSSRTKLGSTIADGQAVLCGAGDEGRRRGWGQRR